MSGYEAETGYHMPFTQSVCIASGYSLQKVWRDMFMYRFQSSMLLPSMTHSLCLVLRKPYKQLSQLCGLPHLIWSKVICNWLWMRLTSIKQHSVQVCLVSMSLLVCLSVCLMWVLVFVVAWRCVLGINSISRSCSISTISVYSAALSTRC